MKSEFIPTSYLQKAKEEMDKLKKLYSARESLLRSLERSIMIEALVPDAFEHGTATIYVMGNAFYPARCRFVIKRGDGSTRELPLCIVPRDLWENSRRLLNETARGTVAAWRK